MTSLYNGLFLESADVQLNWLNQDANSDIAGDRIRLRDYDGVFVVVVKPAGSGGDDLQLDVQQHTAASSGQSKALAVSRLYHKVGAHASTGVWTSQDLATPTGTLDLADLGGTDLGSDVAVTMLGIDIKASDLDANGGYAYVSVSSEGDALSNAMTCSCLYILYGAKSGGRIPTNPLL